MHLFLQKDKDTQVEGTGFEPLLKYKYLTIASGATPIGSTGRAPDDNSGKKKESCNLRLLVDRENTYSTSFL